MRDRETAVIIGTLILISLLKFAFPKCRLELRQDCIKLLEAENNYEKAAEAFGGYFYKPEFRDKICEAFNQQQEYTELQLIRLEREG